MSGVYTHCRCSDFGASSGRFMTVSFKQWLQTHTHTDCFVGGWISFASRCKNYIQTILKLFSIVSKYQTNIISLSLIYMLESVCCSCSVNNLHICRVVVFQTVQQSNMLNCVPCLIECSAGRICNDWASGKFMIWLIFKLYKHRRVTHTSVVFWEFNQKVTNEHSQ